jgi:hypothetical protein
VGSCLACGGAPGTCGQTCPEERRRQARARRGAERAEEARERRAGGAKLFGGAHAALRWYFQTRLAWSSARALPITAMDEGSGAPSLGADAPGRVAFAAVAWAVRLAEKDERATAGGAPVGEWLAAHHLLGRSYDTISEWTNGRWSVDQVKRRLGRAHAVVAERLLERGLLFGSPEADG